MLEVFHIAGIAQALLISLGFVSRRKERGAGLFTALMLTLAALMTVGYLYESGRVMDFPHAARLGVPLLALLASLAYPAVRSLVRPVPFRVRDLSYFLLPVLEIAYLTPFFFSSRENKLRYLEEDLHQLHFDCLLLHGLSFLALLLSLAAGFNALRGRLATARKSEKAYLRRLTIYAGGSLTILGLWSVFSLFDADLINSGIATGIISITLMLIAAERMYSGVGRTAFETATPVEAKYRKSLLPEERMHSLAKEIADCLRSEDRYLDPELRLSDIARELGVSANQVSQAVNRHFHRSFLELLADLRITEARRRLSRAEYDAYSILRIALDCGFNSKSTFNATFRNLTGLTPSEYRRHQIKNGSNPSGSVDFEADRR